jgi:hypothetical protein
MMTPSLRYCCTQFFVGCEVPWERPKSKSASGSQALTLVGASEAFKKLSRQFYRIVGGFVRYV